MTIKQQKADLRLSARHVRQKAHEASGRAAANAIATIAVDFFHDVCQLAGPPIISAYASVGTEVDTGPLLKRLHERDMALALPVTVGRGSPLVFRTWKPGDKTTPGFQNIAEPLPSARALQPDVLFVPLLAFDNKGYRLGYGGGHFDRSLAELRAQKSVIAIGLAYDEQKVDAVPRDRYDQRLDWILTPSGIRAIEVS